VKERVKHPGHVGGFLAKCWPKKDAMKRDHWVGENRRMEEGKTASHKEKQKEPDENVNPGTLKEYKKTKGGTKKQEKRRGKSGGEDGQGTWP